MAKSQNNGRAPLEEDPTRSSLGCETLIVKGYS